MHRPLDILQIAAMPFPTGFGSQVYVRGMCRALVRRGHRVVLACYAPADRPAPREVDVVRGARIPGGHFLTSGPHWSRPLHDAALVSAVRRIRRRVRFDVVHAHHVEGALVARLSGRGLPVVYNQHAAMSDELPSWGLPGAGRALDHLVPRLCAASIGISERGVEQLRAHGARRVAHIPPGVDLDDLQGADAARARQRWELAGRDWVVYAGNADPYQDLPVLFEAMARLPRAGLLFVTPAEVAPWEALADRLGLPPERRRLVQSGDFGDHKDALAAAALAAIPRTRCAGFPIKLLNQLALGVPTVAARGSARPIDGVIPVDDGDPAAMAAAIEALLGDVGRRGGLRQAARAHVRRDWTWDVQAGKVEALYRGMGSGR